MKKRRSWKLTSNPSKPTRKVPMRRCVGCMESKPKKELIRIAGYEGTVTLDPTGKAKGRGVYLCPSSECLEKAKKKKALARSLGMELSEEQLSQLFKDIEAYEK
ncbi:YlxR family protein [Anaerovorax odorimutans]|uniref:YlxR family protein n=2 Tax=Anaerovorax odorimutans TaxID=109327 RepID=A0ABT1RMZ1_9FIRM|nr:YlxR family protein [Anaerovorax odorimutans]